MEPILQIENASTERGTVFWLRNVNLTLEPGIFMGVIGRNGAGKTTLFHMICGLSRISGGDLRLAGVSMRHEPKGVNGRWELFLMMTIFAWICR